MRFIVMHKVDAQMEAGNPPSEGIIKNMGRLVGEGLKSGIFLDGAGLHRSAQRVRLTFLAGACDVQRGPFEGGNQLVAGLAMIKAKSLDDAIVHARRYGDVIGDGEIEIGPVVEPWDLRMMPKPANVEGGRFLLLYKGDQKSEAGVPPRPDVVAGIAKLNDELTAAGVLLKMERLAPSSQGARLGAGPKGERRSWTDGPFAESKELIAGFSILSVKSRDEALAWANLYAEILDGNEVDVRLMVDA